ncbi:MAG: hypothetical protein WCC52_08190 [Nitrosotalea sp.]
MNFLKDPSVENWGVEVEKEDFEHRIHIFYNQRPSGCNLEVGGNLNLEDGKTTLSSYSERIFRADFQWNPSLQQLVASSEVDRRYFKLYQKDLAEQRTMFINFDSEKAKKHLLILIGTSKDGLLMLLDGNHRAQVTYMKAFVTREIEFEPILAMCSISNSELFPFNLIKKLRK